MSSSKIKICLEYYFLSLAKSLLVPFKLNKLENERRMGARESMVLFPSLLSLSYFDMRSLWKLLYVLNNFGLLSCT